MNTHILAAKQMVKQGTGGRIIGAGSIASYRTAENLAPYGATKFAVRGFTEAAAKEWAEHGIRVNGQSACNSRTLLVLTYLQRTVPVLSTPLCGTTLTAS